MPSYVCAKSLQSCLILCDPMDCSLPGSSVHGKLQAKNLERVAMPHSRGYSQPWDGVQVSYVSCIGRQVLYPQCHLGASYTVKAALFTIAKTWKQPKCKLTNELIKEI